MVSAAKESISPNARVRNEVEFKMTVLRARLWL